MGSHMGHIFVFEHKILAKHHFRKYNSGSWGPQAQQEKDIASICRGERVGVYGPSLYIFILSCPPHPHLPPHPLSFRYKTRIQIQNGEKRYRDDKPTLILSADYNGENDDNCDDNDLLREGRKTNIPTVVKTRRPIS